MTLDYLSVLELSEQMFARKVRINDLIWIYGRGSSCNDILFLWTLVNVDAHYCYSLCTQLYFSLTTIWTLRLRMR
jgi:hypothetical protein